ncbi:hypothetical protein AG0111_0g8463 [Alternaria gaisen]|uniref:Uncharacterized protein n=1 Tax=Alternaria gaisen TaxID=167740 RepID=A0ACB6FFU1_9PLEO|nr:hypothetical protein AG0111_0g8463 [Alternaria gaisen]
MVERKAKKVEKFNGRPFLVKTWHRKDPKVPGVADGKAEKKTKAQAKEPSVSLAGEHDKENPIGGFVEEGKYGAW